MKYQNSKIFLGLRPGPGIETKTYLPSLRLAPLFIDPGYVADLLCSSVFAKKSPLLEDIDSETIFS